VVENISRPPASDRAHYSRYRLTMARSLGFKSTHPASPVIWALQVPGQNTHRRAKHSQRSHQECVFALFLSTSKSSKREASVSVFPETQYMLNKHQCFHYPYCLIGANQIHWRGAGNRYGRQALDACLQKCVQSGPEGKEREQGRDYFESDAHFCSEVTPVKSGENVGHRRYVTQTQAASQAAEVYVSS